MRSALIQLKMTAFSEVQCNRKYVQEKALVTSGAFTSTVMPKNPRYKAQHQDKNNTMETDSEEPVSSNPRGKWGGGKMRLFMK